METIEIHPYDLAEIIERLDPRNLIVQAPGPDDVFSHDFLITDGGVTKAYHPSAEVPRTPGNHWIGV